MWRRVLLISLIPILASTNARADRWSLEGGLVLSSYFPTTVGQSPAYAGFGGSGTITYEFPHWSFGVRSQGGLAYSTSFHLVAGSYNLYGDLGRREISLGALGRYFLKDAPVSRGWYLELQFEGRETDFIHADQVYIAPASPDYTRLLLRGGGFSVGAGYRPANGPYFIQLNYELDHFETLFVEGKVDHLHQTLDAPALYGNYFIHTAFITVGLDVFPR